MEDFKLRYKFINSECKTMDGLTVVPNQEAMTIRVKNTSDKAQWGRTAVIPCLNGFTAEVREIKPWAPDLSWYYPLALVPKDFPIDSHSWSKVSALKNKDDPTKKIFGIDPSGDYPCNVKKVSRSGWPPQEDVISIKYEKRVEGQEGPNCGRVTFKCSTFEYV